MKSWLRSPVFVLCLVLAWRVLLLVFTAQPIPEADAFAYDGGVVNYLLNGHYCNPSLAVIFPISGTEIYSTYPPLYQAAVFVWMKLFGTSVISAMSLHLAMFAVSGFLTLLIIRKFFPVSCTYAIAALLFFGFTFDDRPESLAYVFGLGALWLTGRQISGGKFSLGTAAGLTVVLLLGLYTSVMVGAYFFGAGFLACLAACLWRRKWYWFAPFVLAALLFAAITFSITKVEPLWWAGFMESARQQSVMTNGFHAPELMSVIKLVRSVPVFLLALAVIPLMLARRKEVLSRESSWLALTAGVFTMGWVLLFAAITLLAANYVSYVLLAQIILAAGILALVREHFPTRIYLLQAALWGCVLLVSVRAIGMTAWGAACAWENSYQSARTVLRTELKPFVASDQPVLVSSAFLYDAAEMRVKRAIDCQWYFDHAHWTNNAQLNGMSHLRPVKIVLTQFDYYRSFLAPDTPILEVLRQHPELVDVHVRNLAAMPVPDASPSLQRVVQNISWAPVIVDLEWKRPEAP